VVVLFTAFSALALPVLLLVLVGRGAFLGRHRDRLELLAVLCLGLAALSALLGGFTPGFLTAGVSLALFTWFRLFSRP
jgi:hypothetical protein